MPIFPAVVARGPFCAAVRIMHFFVREGPKGRPGFKEEGGREEGGEAATLLHFGEGLSGSGREGVEHPKALFI